MLSERALIFIQEMSLRLNKNEFPEVYLPLKNITKLFSFVSIPANIIDVRSHSYLERIQKRF